MVIAITTCFPCEKYSQTRVRGTAALLVTSRTPCFFSNIVAVGAQRVSVSYRLFMNVSGGVFSIIYLMS